MGWGWGEGDVGWRGVGRVGRVGLYGVGLDDVVGTGEYAGGRLRRHTPAGRAASRYTVSHATNHEPGNSHPPLIPANGRHVHIQR